MAREASLSSQSTWFRRPWVHFLISFSSSSNGLLLYSFPGVEVLDDPSASSPSQIWSFCLPFRRIARLLKRLMVVPPKGTGKPGREMSHIVNAICVVTGKDDI